MSDIEVKEVKRHIYNIDYSKVLLANKNEFVVNKRGISEFSSYLRKYDINSGIIVNPLNYKSGIFYSDLENGYIYASPHYEPETTTFSLDMIGLQKDSFCRIRIIAKTTGNDVSITSDRTLVITDETGTLVFDYDFKDAYDFTTIERIYHVHGTESVLKFSLGKIAIKDIIIDEVTVLEAEEEEQTETDIDLYRSIDEPIAYGYFNLDTELDEEFRYTEMARLSGSGIILVYDKETNTYIIERDNKNETIAESLANLKYYIYLNKYKTDIETEKCTVTQDFSPTTMKQGYYTFDFNGKRTGTLLVIVRRLV